MKLKELTIIDSSPSERAEKLAEAIHKLGKRWVLHPDYRPEENPAHRFYGSYILTKFLRRRYAATSEI